jgi:hypothetical protein
MDHGYMETSSRTKPNEAGYRKLPKKKKKKKSSGI